MLASIMTGTIGWSVYDLSIEHIMSRYLVLLFSFVAGATVGSTVGVVTGLIFSLASVSSFYHMSLLPFLGYLVALKRREKNWRFDWFIYCHLISGMYGEGGGYLLTVLETAALSFYSSYTTGINLQIGKVYPWYTRIYSRATTIYEKNARCYGTTSFTIFKCIPCLCPIAFHKWKATERR